MSEDTEPEGPEKWVREAIEQQQEYLKRYRSCMGQLGRVHRFETFRPKDSSGVIEASDTWRACITCGVTETDRDYKIAKRNDRVA